MSHSGMTEGSHEYCWLKILDQYGPYAMDPEEMGHPRCLVVAKSTFCRRCPEAEVYQNITLPWQIIDRNSVYKWFSIQKR